MSRLTLVADTNLLLQSRPLPELPWTELGSFEEIEVVVTRPVQLEIDRQKGSGNGRLARRARAAHSLLGQIISNDLSPIVILPKSPLLTLALRLDVRPNKELSNRLDYAQPDDELVGIASALAAAGAHVRVLTNDIGVLASAQTMAVPFYKIPDSWALPLEESKQEKELRSAQAEIQRLRDAEPRFDIACVDADGKPTSKLTYTVRHYGPLTAEEKATLVALATSRFPKAKFAPKDAQQQTSDLRPPRVGPIDISELADMSFGPSMPPTEHAIAAYEKLYDDWYGKLVAQLDRAHQRRSAPFAFAFVARNTGTRPAEDVLVDIRARGASLHVVRPPRADADQPQYDRLTLPIPPAPPRARRATEILYESVLRDASKSRYQPSISPSVMAGLAGKKHHDPEAFYYKGSRLVHEPSPVLQLTADLWRHGRDDEEFLAQLFVTDDLPLSGAIEFEIHASNLTDAARLVVSVTFDEVEASTFELARSAIEELELGRPMR